MNQAARIRASVPMVRASMIVRVPAPSSTRNWQAWTHAATLPGAAMPGRGRCLEAAPSSRASAPRVKVVTEQPKMKTALFVAAGAATLDLNGGLRRATRPVGAIMEFVKNVLRAISPFKGSRDDDDAPATAGALNGLAAAAKKPAAAAPAPTRSSARQAAKAKAPAKRAHGVPNIRVSRLSYVVVERRARLPTSSDRGGGGRRRRGRAGPRRAASPAARGAAGPAAPTRPSQSQAAPSSPSRAARHRVRSERLGGPPTDATTPPNERSS